MHHAGRTSEYRVAADRVLLALLFGLLAVLCCHRIIDVDIWWHLRTGQWIVEHGQVPAVDIYSYPSAGRTWIDLHWLYQVGVYALFRLGGASALVGFTVATLALTFGLLTRLVLRRDNGLAVGVMLWVSLLAFERFHSRPEIVSELLLAIYICIVYAYRTRRSRWLYLLPVLQVVWVNVEGLFVLGPLLLAAHLVGETLTTFGRLPFMRREDVLNKRDLYRLAAVLLAVLAVCLLNPYGGEGALFPLVLATRLGGGGDVFSATIQELAPPFLQARDLLLDVRPYKLLIVLSALSFAVNIRRGSWGRLFTYGGFLCLSLLAWRNIPLFVCVAYPYSVLNWSEWREDIRLRRGCRDIPGRARVLYRLAQVGLMVFVSFMIYAVATNRYAERKIPLAQFGVDWSDCMYPSNAVDFLEREKIDGNMFNNIGIGGYLCWRGYPDRKVFIDGRLEVPEEPFYRDYVHVMMYPAYWDDLVDAYDIDYAVLQHSMGDTQYLIQSLHQHPQWVLVFWDDTTVIYLRDNPRNRAQVARLRCDFHPRPSSTQAPEMQSWEQRYHPRRWLQSRRTPFAHIHRGTFLALIGQDDRAVTEYVQALQLDPDNVEARYNLGLLYIRQEAFSDALRELGQVLSGNPDHVSALTAMAYAQYRVGRFEEACELYQRAHDQNTLDVKCLYDWVQVYLALGNAERAVMTGREAVSINPGNARAHACLAQACIALRDFQQAAASAKQAVAVDPRYVEAYDLLGFACRQLGRINEATDAYRQAVRLAPANRTARNNLAVIYAKQGDYTKARREWRRVLELDPAHQEARQNLERLAMLGGKR